jgi:tetratricopeptide (TPR) repeat protein
LYRSALQLDRRLFGDEHPYVATVMNNLAAVLAVKAEYDEAARLFTDSLAMFRRVYGDDHWRIGTVQGGLAGVLSARGNPAAEGLYREAIAHLERVLGPEHPSLEPLLIGLGRHLTNRMRAGEAEDLLRRALRTRAARLGENDPRTAEAQVRLGICLAALGRAPEAGPLLESGFDRLRNEPAFKMEAEEASSLMDRSGHPRR